MRYKGPQVSHQGETTGQIFMNLYYTNSIYVLDQPVLGLNNSGLASITPSHIQQ